MSVRDDMTIPFEPGQAYHLFNRGINRQPIFFLKGNQEYFLKKYFAYSEGYWKTYAWCLLEDHFHFLIKVESATQVLKKASKDFRTVDRSFAQKHEELLPSIDLPNFKNLADLVQATPHNLLNQALCQWAVSQRLRRWLLSYSKAINKQEKRTGSLFQKTIRRKRITSHTHLKSVCAYIHRNPIHHGYVAHAEDYPWCSYQLWTNAKAIENPEIINCYDSIDEMRQSLESSTDNWEESFG